MAVLSHFLHNLKHKVSDAERLKILWSIRDFLAYKKNIDVEDVSGEEVVMAAEHPLEQTLFSEFYQVPFPNPQNASRTFIDLFAGIGGIRLPFSELGYQCVFSSEWD